MSVRPKRPRDCVFLKSDQGKVAFVKALKQTEHTYQPDGVTPMVPGICGTIYPYWFDGCHATEVPEPYQFWVITVSDDCFKKAINDQRASLVSSTRSILTELDVSKPERDLLILAADNIPPVDRKVVMPWDVAQKAS